MISKESYRDFLKKTFLEASQILTTADNSNGQFIEREIKLEADQKLDQFFRSHLEKHTGLPVYSEESLGKFPDDKTTCWIVDPLDGSLNFSRRIPFFTSSVCLWDQGSPVVGAIYDYSHNDFYFAEKQKGAYLNSNKISPSSKNNIIKASGIPSHTSVDKSLRMFSSSLKEYKKIRWLGCASLSMAYLASGKVDAYEELGIKLWDVAAGIIIVEESGGRVEYTFNSDGTLNVLAGSA